MTPQQQHLALVVLAAGTTAVWCVGLLRGHGRRGAVELVWVVAGMAAAWLAFPLGLDVGWLTPLQEASSEELLRIARGEGLHAGPLWTRLLEGLARVPVVVDGRAVWVGRLDGAVRLGAAAAVGAGLLTMLTLARRGTAWLVVPAVAGHRVVGWWVGSEGPAGVVWLLAAMLGVALGEVHRAPGDPGGAAASRAGLRRTWWTAGGGLVLLLALLRVELGAAAVVVSAVVWAGGRAGAASGPGADTAGAPPAPSPPRVMGRPGWWGLIHRASGLEDLPPRDRAFWRLVLVGCGVAGLLALLAELWVGGRLDRWGRAAWVVQAFHPLDPSPVVLPLLLLSTLGPGVLALVLLGRLEGLRRPIGTAAAGLVLLLLFKLYHAAGHGPLLFHPGFLADEELVRYLGLLLPLVVVVAAQGWARAPRWRLLLVLPWPALTLVWAWWPWSRAWQEPERPWVPAALAFDAQVEVRLLVQALYARPECALATRSADQWVIVPSPLADGEQRRARALPGGLGADALGRALGVCVLVDVGITCHAPGARCERPEAPVVEAAAWAHPAHGWPVEGPFRPVVWVVEPGT